MRPCVVVHQNINFRSKSLIILWSSTQVFGFLHAKIFPTRWSLSSIGLSLLDALLLLVLSPIAETESIVSTKERTLPTL